MPTNPMPEASTAPAEVRNAFGDSFSLYQLQRITENRELRYLPMSELRGQAQEFRSRVHTITEDIEDDMFRNKRQVEAYLRDKGFDVKSCEEPDKIIVHDDMGHQSELLLRYGIDHCLVDGYDTSALNALVDGSRYECVYSGPLPDECAGITDLNSVLESIYFQMNLRHPVGYLAPSMSTSDVVALTMNDQTRYYYTDSIGFQQLEDFHLPENALHNAELSMEDDYDMIDGMINNGSKQKAVEERTSLYKQLKAQCEKVPREGHIHPKHPRSDLER